MTMSEQQRVEFLSTLGIEDAPAKPAPQVQAPVQNDDRATMQVSDIVFDPADVAEFGTLEGLNFRHASDKLFAMYRSPGRNTDRHGLLHRRITEFLGKQRTLLKSGGFVKDKIVATKEQREIAALLAAAGLTMEDLAPLLKSQNTDEEKA